LPPLNAMRAFEAAARHLSFARAADELSVTPAAISHHIRDLEAFAGQTLFRRNGRSVELTDVGHAARAHVSDAIASLHEAARVMRLPLRSRRVSVSAAPSFAAKWLIPRLERFYEAYPDIEVWVSADLAVTDFATADVDLAVRYGPGGYDGVHSELLMTESVAPLCSPRLIEAGVLKAPEDLGRVTLLHDESADRDPTCPTWPMWLRAQGITHADGRAGPRFNQSSLVLEAAVAGRGVALGKRQLAGLEIQGGRLIAPFEGADTPISFGYWLVWPRGRTLTPALRTFLDWVRAAARIDDVADGAGI